jgi:DNA-binding XRE family transcriptional regulator
MVHGLMKISQNTLMMISGSFAQAITVFYIFISKWYLCAFASIPQENSKNSQARNWTGKGWTWWLPCPKGGWMIMKTWNDYKEHVRTVDPEIGKDIDEVENISSIVSAMVEQRTSLGLSQRELAAMCGIPQSSVARIESCKTTPNLGTLLNIFQHLGLQLTVRPTKPTV